MYVARIKPDTALHRMCVAVLKIPFATGNNNNNLEATKLHAENGKFGLCKKSGLLGSF